MKKFNEYSRFNLSEINQEILKQWKDRNIFERSIAEREGCPSYVFFEGPPSANGMPGIHHVMARSIKDIFCRYKTMKGYQVHRKAGWDTHGLPVELGVEKSLGITKEDIGKKISVDEYNNACRTEVMKYTRQWENLTDTMGYWVDMEDPYITYDNRYIESVWWLLSQMYKKGYLYKGYTIQPYSPAAGTGLSTHELNQPGCYRDVKDTTCIAEFPITSPTEVMKEWGSPYFLAWTTTPWTLPSNAALCVGANIDYVVIRTYNPYSGSPITIVMAEALVKTVLNPKGEGLDLDSYVKGDKVIPYVIVDRMKGSDLKGFTYAQLFPWVNPGEGAFKVIVDPYVTTEDGTGIVHIAATFGADDNRVSKANGVPGVTMIDKDGNIRPMVDLRGRFFRMEDLDTDFVKERVNVEEYGPWAGKYVKNAFDPEATEETETLDVQLCLYLKSIDRVFKIEKHTHSYPHCWRTDKPVIYYPLDSWFIKSTAARDHMIELNNTIKWKPASTGSGRFGKWLENLQDWNLSRSRYWGTPLPIWRTEDGSEEVCIGSVEELYAAIDESVKAGVMESNPYANAGFVPGDYTKSNYEKIDLHRPYVDDIVLVSKDGKPMHRETDLIDVWFDSGSMPYAQLHYPFENKDKVERGTNFPADFIAEGVDQTRGWFFTLHAIATMIFDSVAYKAVISNGLVLDKNGNKMSKRFGNAVNPFETLEKYGADPVRWYMISNSAPWDNLKFDLDGVQESARKMFATLYNTYSFFALYANVDGFTGEERQIPLAERPEIDRWIISMLNSLIIEVEQSLEDYEPTKAARAINEFVNDNLSNWYVRLNRKRFWGGEMTDDKLAAYETLYECLYKLSLIIAPIAPFYADKLYQDLTRSDETVHLARFPEVDMGAIDKELEQRMSAAQTITSMTLALRRKVNIKVRQPLQSIMIPVMDDNQRRTIEAVGDIIRNEVNVKEIRIVSSDEGILVKKVKPDFKKLGPKHGKQMKSVAAAIASLDQASINALEKDGHIDIAMPDNTMVTVDATDVEIMSQDIPGWLVGNEGSFTIALDITITPELRQEGIAREIINRVQNIRKARQYDITDRINLIVSPNEYVAEAVTNFADYISNQVLASSITIGEISNVKEDEHLDIDGVTIDISIELQ